MTRKRYVRSLTLMAVLSLDVQGQQLHTYGHAQRGSGGQVHK